MKTTDDWRDETLDEAGTKPGRAMTSPDEARQVVLVAVDFSGPGRRALTWALDHAQRAASELHTIHVLERRWRLADLRADPATVRHELDAVHQEVATALAAMLDDDTRARLGPVHEHVILGAPAEEIITLATEIGAQLIVIGSHSRDAIAHALLGSVAERVVRAASCPVVVVKNAGS
jgi:nucleotide-binding universal stress UspA family protein